MIWFLSKIWFLLISGLTPIGSRPNMRTEKTRIFYKFINYISIVVIIFSYLKTQILTHLHHWKNSFIYFYHKNIKISRVLTSSLLIILCLWPIFIIIMNKWYFQTKKLSMCQHVLNKYFLLIFNFKNKLTFQIFIKID